MASRYKGRRKGVRIRIGSVAQARKEAGLTLAGVAGDLVSRSAIHLIEKGRVLPSIETLTHVAARTNKPQSFFVAIPGVQPKSGERN
jgi:transcriptional regulator with XRE-family HTH domain